jgi:hypothetical protein
MVPKLTEYGKSHGDTLRRGGDGKVKPAAFGRLAQAGSGHREKKIRIRKRMRKRTGKSILGVISFLPFPLCALCASVAVLSFQKIAAPVSIKLTKY